MRIYAPVDGPDRLPQAMVEGSTEYDWAELPEPIKQVMRAAANTLEVWAANAEPIAGEVVPDPAPPIAAQQPARCHAQHNDGDCDWIGCPQISDRQPHCPLDDGKDPYE